MDLGINNEQVYVKQEAIEVPTKQNSNRKERKRTQCINSAFGELRKCIPNVPTDTKLSKIKTLRLAISYIQYLTEMLDTEEEDVREAKIIAYEIATRNDLVTKRKRMVKRGKQAEKELLKQRGRSGWPQHVWALDLR